MYATTECKKQHGTFKNQTEIPNVFLTTDP